MGGSYHPDGDTGRWLVSVYWEGKRYRIFRYMGESMTKPTAKKLLGKIQGEIDDGTFNPRTYFPDSPLSTNEYAKRWLTLVDVKANTLKDYRGAVNGYIIPFFGEKDLRHIRHADIVEFQKYIQTGTKRKYNIVSTLRTMLRWAWRNEDIKAVPPFPKLSMGEKPKVKHYTLEQQEKVLKAIPERHRAIFAFGMEFGLRIGELRALQWDCIEDGRVYIRRAFGENKLEESTKTSKSRDYTLTPYAAELLKILPVTSPTFIFVRDDGKPYTDKNLNAIWKEAFTDLNIEKIPITNAVRHSLGCQLLRAGTPIKTVKDIYGHSKIEMTERYVESAQADVTEALVNRRATVYQLTKKEVDKINEIK